MKSFDSHVRNLKDKYVEISGDVLNFDPDSREWKLAVFVYEMLAHEEMSDAEYTQRIAEHIKKQDPDFFVPQAESPKHFFGCTLCRKQLSVDTDDIVWMTDGPVCKRCKK